MSMRSEDRTSRRWSGVSEREVVVTRSFDAPAGLVFEAWSKPELFERWWAPKGG